MPARFQNLKIKNRSFFEKVVFVYLSVFLTVAMSKFISFVNHNKKMQKNVAQIRNNCYHLVCCRKDKSPNDLPTELTAIARS